MFNALGLGFSFVLAAALLPEGEGEGEGPSTDCSNSSITVSDLKPVKSVKLCSFLLTKDFLQL